MSQTKQQKRPYSAWQNSPISRDFWGDCKRAVIEPKVDRLGADFAPSACRLRADNAPKVYRLGTNNLLGLLPREKTSDII